ncbi:MAG: SGNH/GDSL hydrolase family protein [Gammaproteobacteria bacterium]|nr:SGNH/GDSL hydrolase family protein [Gammaproteobacteria bacterium]MDH4310526.1 SGNH/GDSL hydrolase family protein [Gammaproteobacteria bacterium]MDH5271492.1 SGNH/GDSL hydrolase family protein [Gammaproteobacteria bacterium]
MATRLPPVAFLQALRVLLATPRLAPPLGESGRIGADGPDALRIIGVGDSIIAGTGVQQLRDSLTAAYARLLHARTQRPVEWQARGRNGATSASVLRELVPTVPAGDLYLLSVGVNDVTRRVAADAYGRNVAGIHERLRERAPASAILFAGVPPLERFPALPAPLNSLLGAQARGLQQAAAEALAGRPRTYCYSFPETVPPGDFARDGFHPAESAVLAWAGELLALTGQDDVASCSR